MKIKRTEIKTRAYYGKDGKHKTITVTARYLNGKLVKSPIKHDSITTTQNYNN